MIITNQPTPTINTMKKPVRLIGIGDAGNQIVSKLSTESRVLTDVICVNTDSDSLNNMNTAHRVLLMSENGQCIGTGGDVTIGEKIAKNNMKILKDLVIDASMVLIVAGLGGGTGSGISTVIAEAAKKTGALTISLVTTPFSFEGNERKTIAVNKTKTLASICDGIFPIANDEILGIPSRGHSNDGTFSKIIEMCTDLIKITQVDSSSLWKPHISISDLRSIMNSGGFLIAGYGKAHGLDAPLDAIKSTIDNLNLNRDILSRIKKVGVCIFGGKELSIGQIATAMGKVKTSIPMADGLDLGICHDNRYGQQVKVFIFATIGSQINHLPTSSSIRIDLHKRFSITENEDSIPVPLFN